MTQGKGGCFARKALLCVCTAFFVVLAGCQREKNRQSWSKSELMDVQNRFMLNRSISKRKRPIFTDCFETGKLNLQARSILSFGGQTSDEQLDGRTKQPILKNDVWRLSIFDYYSSS
jgi:hypothetical protein